MEQYMNDPSETLEKRAGDLTVRINEHLWQSREVRNTLRDLERAGLHISIAVEVKPLRDKRVWAEPDHRLLELADKLDI